MDDVFNKLQSDGKNDVDGLMKWIKDSKLVDGSKEQEDKARELFNDVPNPKNVEIGKFKEIIQKLAEFSNKNFDQLTSQLAAEGPKLMQSAMAGASALAGSLKM